MTTEATAIAPNSRVLLHLQILLEDGTEALSTLGDDPLDFSIGDGTLALGLEQLVQGLEAGTDTHFLASGSDLFGPRTPDKIHWMARADFPLELEPAPGQVLAFDTPGGQEIAGTVLAVEADRVQMDLNHPLAGRALRIRVQVLSVTRQDKSRHTS